MSPFTSSPGACVSAGIHARNIHIEAVGAADSACQRLCYDTITANPSKVAGRCVAYSTSTKVHESSHCAIYDALGFGGPGGDAHPHRTCSLVDPSSVLPDVVFDPLPLDGLILYQQQLDARQEPPGLTPAPPPPPRFRWLE